MKIDLHSEENAILMNPRMSPQEQSKWLRLLESVPNLKAHVWIATSGSTGAPKWAALSKKALLVSANAVNKHLNATKSDCWLNHLPLFHVGGLGIFARGLLSESKVVHFNQKWSPDLFVSSLNSNKATLTSLVPTQLFDLIQQRHQAPDSLRACIIGGGALSPILFEAATKLGWPILPSYGLTECCSQVATAIPGNPALKILTHVQCKIMPSGKLGIKSDALLTLYAIESANKITLSDPKVDGWLEVEDKGLIEGNYLIIIGRESHFIKIGGESVNLHRLRELLDTLCFQNGKTGKAVLAAIPDERLGHIIHLVIQEDSCAEIAEKFNELVLPFERIRKVHNVDHFPMIGPGKIDYTTLSRMIACASTSVPTF